MPRRGRPGRGARAGSGSRRCGRRGAISSVKRSAGRRRGAGRATNVPRPGIALQEALGDQRVHGLAHGHPGHAELLHELALGGRRCALRRPATRSRTYSRTCTCFRAPLPAAWSSCSTCTTDRAAGASASQLRDTWPTWAMSERTGRTPGYSVAIARSTSSRAARRAGSTAASTPTPPRGQEDDQLCPRHAITSRPWSRTAYIIATPKQTPSTTPEHGPQHRHHHRLQGDHQPQLTAAQADGAQQADLAGALDDRQRERVHDAEHGDHQRQAEQGVDHQHQLVDRRALLARRTRPRPSP